MVVELPVPKRPLQGGKAWPWLWRHPSASHPWEWCRIYHRSAYTPSGISHRTYGPLSRLDSHTVAPGGKPWQCPDGRSVLYVAGNLATAIGEVFGDYTSASVCPNFRVVLVRPVVPVDVLNLRGQGTALRLGALPSLATGTYPRPRTQEWARAIFEDQPVARKKIHGVYYDAAHTNGPALALWNTERSVEIVRDYRGSVQDFALADSKIWPRVVSQVVGIGMRADLVASCPRCS